MKSIKEDKNILTVLSESVKESCKIDVGLFEKYNVKKGLRNADHTGVLVGLTNIGDVVGYKKDGEKMIPVEGKLYYRGIEVEDLVKGAQQEHRHGFDEVIYLLLSGYLPKISELSSFTDYLGSLTRITRQFYKKHDPDLKRP